MRRYRRSFRIIRPRFQFKFILSFLGISALGLLLQYLVFARLMSEVALGLPSDSALMLDDLARQLTQVLLVSFGLLLPITIVIGVLVTHRIAGPLHRLETHLRAVIDGKTRDDCRLRSGDELQELCELINQATAAHREMAPKLLSTEPNGEDSRAAA